MALMLGRLLVELRILTRRRSGSGWIPFQSLVLLVALLVLPGYFLFSCCLMVLPHDAPHKPVLISGVSETI